jgi:hypothetical protein
MMLVFVGNVVVCFSTGLSLLSPLSNVHRLMFAIMMYITAHITHIFVVDVLVKKRRINTHLYKEENIE